MKRWVFIMTFITTAASAASACGLADESCVNRRRTATWCSQYIDQETCEEGENVGEYDDELCQDRGFTRDCGDGFSYSRPGGRCPGE